MSAKTKENLLAEVVPTIVRRVPSLRTRDIPALQDVLAEFADSLAGTGAPVVAPLTSDEIALIRDSLRAKVSA